MFCRMSGVPDAGAGRFLPISAYIVKTGDFPEAFLDGIPAGYHPALQLVQKGRLDALAVALCYSCGIGHADDRSAFGLISIIWS